MKNSIRKFYFNIIEVALAMAIIGLGMTSIMALFPIGINASRSAIGNTSATEIAEGFMGFIKSYAETDQIKYGNIKAIAGVTTVDTFRNTLKGKNLKQNDVTCQFLTDFKAGSIGPTEEYNEVNAKWKNLFKNNSRNYLYTAIQRKDNSSTEPDFSAAIILWKSYLNKTGSNPEDLNASGNTGLNWPVDDDDSDIFALNAEVSWPLSKLYKDREKRYFQVIIVKP